MKTTQTIRINGLQRIADSVRVNNTNRIQDSSNDHIVCHQMTSKEERETVDYLLQQEGAMPCGKGWIFHTQL